MKRSATVALISDKKVLVLRRGPTAPWMPGIYCLPGGHRDDYESLENCAVRELCEETGIVLVANELEKIHVKYTNGYENTIFFYNKGENYEVNLNWEHDHYMWINSLEAKTTRLVPNLDTTIKTLAENDLIY
jgi:8-oxo-dGTP pyrophosphatase MutT (NUDIX family)